MSELFPPAEEGIRGRCLRVLRVRGEEAALVVGRSDGSRVVVVGPLAHVMVGDELEARGEPRRSAYGWEYRVEEATVRRPSDPEGLIRFLVANAEGVGEKTARLLVAALGDEVLAAPGADVIAARLGVGARRAARLAAALAPLAAVPEGRRAVALFLAGLDLSPRKAEALYRRFGGDLRRRLDEDPYGLIGAVDGLGFATVDRLALSRGVARDDPRRRRAGILHTLRHRLDEGDLYVTRAELAHALATLGVEVAADDVARLAAGGSVVIDEGRVYLAEAWQAEVAVARAVAQRLAGPSERPLLRAITGGPGTGKTTLVERVVAQAEAQGRRVALAAPSGRAARRLAEATGRPARTIHRLLGIGPTGRPPRGRCVDAELVVVDEASMCDLFLMRDLLGALRKDAELVLVGDPDQLPPVGPGQPFRDLLRSGLLPTEALTHIWRQGEGSGIARSAPRLREGLWPELGPDVRFVEATGFDAVAAFLRSYLRGRRPPREDPDLRAWQVLTPGHRGRCGVEALNLFLQALLNPGSGRLRPGDKVMQVANDYDRGVMNGEIGRVVAVSGGEVSVVFPDLDEDRRVRYPRGQGLELAYAMTVHKAQGSEFDSVVVVVSGEHYPLLQRNLVYTAATRARRELVFLGQRRALWSALRREGRPRASRLAERLTALLAEGVGNGLP